MLLKSIVLASEGRTGLLSEHGLPPRQATAFLWLRGDLRSPAKEEMVMPDDRTEANKALVRRFIEQLVAQRGSPDVFNEMMAENATGACNGIANFQSRDDFEANAQQIFAGFPDLEIARIEDVIAEGDTVAIRWTGHATHDGTFLGLAATGQRVLTTNIEMYRIENGKIAFISSMPDVESVLVSLLRRGPLEAPVVQERSE
jgi:steroid delta-isomerase-like uncharacterized protein